MINYYKYPDKETWGTLVSRPCIDSSDLKKSVKKIMRKVKKDGDRALLKFAKLFDGVKLSTIEVTESEITEAANFISTDLKEAILLAKSNIECFHRSQIEQSRIVETMPGVSCWRKSIGIEKVGLYIPGGSAPLFSTVLMLAIPATLAGCREIILCTPSGKKGKIHPAILYAASICGITKVYKAGGAQAIAAMTYGTDTIPNVFKIFGPGNQYVTEAKKMASQKGVAIDMPAGPSEVLVIADESAIPEFVAADLLSQAEHGPDSQVILVTNNMETAIKTEHALNHQLKKLPRKSIAEKTLSNSRFIITKDIEEAINFSNCYAPEHLILATINPEKLAEKITNAGSVFLGNFSPESAGDYASGTNHTLPTAGYAAMYSGVSVDSFVKKITFQQLTKEGLKGIGNAIMTMAEAEGLEGHKNAVAIRLK